MYQNRLYLVEILFLCLTQGAHPRVCSHLLTLPKQEGAAIFMLFPMFPFHLTRNVNVEQGSLRTIAEIETEN